MKTDKTPPPTLALLVYAKNDRDFYHITANVVTLSPNKEIRNPRNSSYDGDEQSLADLQIYSQGDSYKTTEPRKLYGWSIGYHDVFSVDLRRATGMVKRLKAIETKLDKMYETRGPAVDLAEYVARCAEALKVKTIIFQTAQGAASSYDDGRYQFRPVADGVYQIRQMEREWIAKGQPVDAIVTADTATA